MKKNFDAICREIRRAHNPTKQLYWKVAETLIPGLFDEAQPARSRISSKIGAEAWLDASCAIQDALLPGYSILCASGPKGSIANIHENTIGTPGTYYPSGQHQHESLARLLAIVTAVQAVNNKT